MFKSLRVAALAVSTMGLGLVTAGLSAAELGVPTGPIVLTVGGNIRNTNADGEARFDREMLEALGLTELRTTTPWTEGLQVFEGVAVEHILGAVGANGADARAVALNDYVVEMELAFLREAQALIAVKLNGDYMRVRDKGPLWIVFPWDQRPELDEEFLKSLSVWQLNRLEIR